MSVRVAELTIAKFPVTEDCSGALKNRHVTEPLINKTICDAKTSNVPAKTTYRARITSFMKGRNIFSLNQTKPMFTTWLGRSYHFIFELLLIE